MNEKINTISYNYEAECERLKTEMVERTAMHLGEVEDLKRRIAELEHDLMIYEQKWSVIQLIFGK